MGSCISPGASPPPTGGAETVALSQAALPAALQPPTAAAAASEHSLLGAATDSSVGGQLSALTGDGGGLSSRQHSVLLSRDDLSRNLSMQPPRSPLGCGGAAPEGEKCGCEAGAADEVAPAAAEAAPAPAASGEPAAAAEPAPVAEAEAAPESRSSVVAAPKGSASGRDSPSHGSPSDGDDSLPAADSSSTDVDSEGDSAAASPANPSGGGSPARLSVRQLVEAREKERQAAGAAAQPAVELAREASGGGSTASSPQQHRGRAPSLPSSRSHSRLASCHSSTVLLLSTRRPGRTGAAAASSRASSRAPGNGSPPGSARRDPGSAASSRSSSRLGADPCGCASSLLRPTASYAAAREVTQSRRQLRQEESLPCAYQPKATELQPFKLACDERAQYDHARVADAAKLTSEERKANKPLQFELFKLRSLERHEAYAQQFARKVEEEQRREEDMHRTPSHGSRSPSRIAALHGSSPGGGGSSSGGSTPRGGSSSAPPALAMGQRAARHEERSAERRKREEEEAAQREAERMEQLTAEERAEEEERRQHRFKARPMPDMSRPAFAPDKSKAQPATVPREFKFRSSSRLHNK